MLLEEDSKNEFGDGSSDPSMPQAGLSIVRSWLQPEVSYSTILIQSASSFKFLKSSFILVV